MRFIRSKRCEDRFVGAKHVSNLNVRISANGATIEEEFIFLDLEKLKEELEDVIFDIEEIFRIENDKQD